MLLVGVPGFGLFQSYTWLIVCVVGVVGYWILEYYIKPFAVKEYIRGYVQKLESAH